MWAFPITSTGHVLCQAIIYSGNFIYITGSFAGTANFGNGFTLNTGNSWSDSLGHVLAKLRLCFNETKFIHGCE